MIAIIFFQEEQKILEPAVIATEPEVNKLAISKLIWMVQ